MNTHFVFLEPGNRHRISSKSSDISVIPRIGETVVLGLGEDERAYTVRNVVYYVENKMIEVWIA